MTAGTTRSSATGRGSRGCSRASSAGRDLADRRRRTGARSPGTTSPPSTARTPAAASPTRPTRARVFSWLICETRDDKGNAVVYEYKPEDGAGVDLGAAARAQPRRRGDPRAAQPLPQADPLRQPGAAAGRGRAAAALPDRRADRRRRLDVRGRLRLRRARRRRARRRRTTGPAWPCRPDPFSTYRAGFEVRTYRLCRRVLMFHHFPDEAGVGADCLVRSTDLTLLDEQTRPIRAARLHFPAVGHADRATAATATAATSSAVAAAARVRVHASRSSTTTVARGRRRTACENLPDRAGRRRLPVGRPATARASRASSPSRPAPGSTSAT